MYSFEDFASFEPLNTNCLLKYLILIRQNSQVRSDREDKNRWGSSVTKNRVLLAIQKIFNSGEKDGHLHCSNF
jgi:hypothetical protein